MEKNRYILIYIISTFLCTSLLIQIFGESGSINHLKANILQDSNKDIVIEESIIIENLPKKINNVDETKSTEIYETEVLNTKQELVIKNVNIENQNKYSTKLEEKNTTDTFFQNNDQNIQIQEIDPIVDESLNNQNYKQNLSDTIKTVTNKEIHQENIDIKNPLETHWTSFIENASPIIKRSFDDVEPSHWAYAHIESVVKENIMTGFEDGNFYPDRFLTHADLMRIALRINDTYIDFDIDDSSFFTDIYSKMWNHSGTISSENENRAFNANEIVSKAEALRILLNVAGFDKDNISINQALFTDIDTIVWLRSYINYAIDMNIFENTQTEFIPNEPINRALTSKIIDSIRK